MTKRLVKLRPKSKGRPRRRGEAMTDAELRALLSLFAAADPSPVSPAEQWTLLELVNRESKARGYLDWLDAYHRL